jgi:6-phosphogluconate dehydrogenase
MIVPCETIEELAAAIRPPRPVIIMVQAGKPVDEQIAALLRRAVGQRHHHRCRQRRTSATPAPLRRTEGSGLTFIGMGVSGGEEGARHGPSIMVGGTEQSWKRVEKVLTAISAKYEGEPAPHGWARMAPATSSRRSTTASNMPTCR